MKKLNILIAAIFSVVIFLLPSCYTPSPIYGTWADNMGSKFTFVSDGTYTASITNIETNISTRYSGSWTVMDNVLIFTKGDGSTLNTEWDIRGSMLYLDWTDEEGGIQHLTLYHVSK